MQRENMQQITQPSSPLLSPLVSPAALGSTTSSSFCLPSNNTNNCNNNANTNNIIDTADPNWQSTKPTVRERNASMFNNELMADIKFIVGDGKHFFIEINFMTLTSVQIPLLDPPQTIPAHKYVLATGSSVFYAMFYGGLADNKMEINVPDVEPTAFLTLLK